MTVQQMRYVMEVSKAGSITQAAKNLFITPSSISSGIHSLEKELGYTIFARSWQGVELTPKGRQVLNHATYICERLQQIERGTVDTGRKGFCLVSGTYTPFNNAFSQLAKEYIHSTSARYVQQKMRDRFEGMDEVAANNADLMMVCGLDSSLSRFEPSISRRNLAWELRKIVPAVAVIGPGHRLYHEEEIRLEQLAGDAVIDSITAKMTDYGVFKQHIPINLNHAILVQDREQRFELVRNGAGFQICPKQPERTNRQYGLRSIPIPNSTFHIISVTNARIPMSEETRRYLELVDAELDDIEV